MAFPDDYRRVQQAGGIQADVNSHIGLPRQLLIDTTNQQIRLMDGVTPGGNKVVMESNYAGLFNAQAEGEVAYVEDQVTNDPTDIKRLWRSSKLRLLFQKLADMTDTANWVVKDAAMPKNLRASAEQITDLDAALLDGWYRFVPNATVNMPGDLPSGGTDQYMMMVIRQSSSELTQVIFSRAADGKIWTRSRVAGVFQAWTLATGVTTADLLLKVDKAGDTMTGKLTLPVSTNVLAQLNLRNGVFPAAPVDGDIARDDANGGLRFRKGGTTVNLLDTLNRPKESIALICDQKAAGTHGGTSLTAGWLTRDLNTELFDPDGIVSISSNQFTVSVDCEAEWTSQSFLSGRYKTRLYNVTDAVVVDYSTLGYSYTSANAAAVAEGYSKNLVAGKTYRIEYICEATCSPNGLGIAGLAGMGTEIYLIVSLRRKPL